MIVTRRYVNEAPEQIADLAKSGAVCRIAPEADRDVSASATNITDPIAIHALFNAVLRDICPPCSADTGSVNRNPATMCRSQRNLGRLTVLVGRRRKPLSRGKMAKRSGRWIRVTLDEHIKTLESPDVDVIALDHALIRLSAFDARKSRIAELRFFAGLSLEETGHVIGLSVATVERERQVARAWLYAALKGEPRS